MTPPRHTVSFWVNVMSSAAAATPTPPRPSVFISYASEDRAAARALRDTLAATGLDVWYDENELGGGDSWDQKIRRQIRDCDYFMPMISAATEARKEGYFRREWRLAAERTLDMADDVMFLLPVSIDSTSEAGARVPDKFLSVQWLRLPGGQSTPALEALCRRLLAGEHTAPPRPTSVPFSRPPHAPPIAVPPPLLPPKPAAPPPPPIDDSAHHPPEKPPFPHVPEKGGLLHGIKFLAEVVWWAVTAAWVLIKRAPKWIRVLLSIWFVFFVFSQCGRNSSDNPTEKRAAKSKVTDAIRRAAEKADKQPEKDLTPSEAAKLGAEFARTIAAGLEGKVTAGKQLAVVPFDLSIEGGAASRFADAVFNATYGRLVAARPTEAVVATETLDSTTDAALVAHGKKLGTAFVLAARLTNDPPRALAVRLVRIDDSTVPWSKDFPVDDSTVAAVATQIAESVLAAVPKK
ncbi:MAG: toll/interleukin-1 receptor domain-containing protein [Verrucomicrobia bacterium]|nr:toll/interleukin-1 receptor domain-containing protein [Verrucomicrobiota bacterium]